MESPRALPLACPCENGGTCEAGEGGAAGGEEVVCRCRAPLLPPRCAAPAAPRAGSAHVLLPALLAAALALAAAAAAFFIIRKRPL